MPEHAGEGDRQAGDDDAHDGRDGGHDAEVGGDAARRKALAGGHGHAPEST